MAMLGNPYNIFASQFRSPYSMMGGGLFGSYMPSVSRFQSAISPMMSQPQSRKEAKKFMPQQIGLQYNPITQLSDIPKPNPLGWNYGGTDQGAGAGAGGGQQQASTALTQPQTLAEQVLLNQALGRGNIYQGVDRSQLTQDDVNRLRRNAWQGGAPAFGRSLFGYG